MRRIRFFLQVGGVVANGVPRIGIALLAILRSCKSATIKATAMSIRFVEVGGVMGNGVPWIGIALLEILRSCRSATSQNFEISSKANS